MTTNTRSSGQIRVAPLLWILCGFLLFFVLFFDPLGLHPLDSWLQSRMGLQASPEQGSAGAITDETTLWTCPMHPHILEEEPGDCPICGMSLVATGETAGPSTESTTVASGEREILFYRNPMDPTITSPVPAQDDMGMEYTPVYADEAEALLGAGTIVRIDPAVVQNMNVQTATVIRRSLSKRIRSVGYLEYDQERMVTVTTKYDGWIEKVYVNYVGEPVRKGQALFEIYSPDLVQTELELLSAIEYAEKFEDEDEDVHGRARGLVEAARTRLGYWDVSSRQIDELERTRKIFRTLTVTAPASGVVMKRMAGLEGMAVRPGMETYHIADLSSLWLSVEIFEDQMAWIGVGTSAEVAFTYAPGETMAGTVRFIEPEFSEETRTLRAKIQIPNRDGKLRAGMYATVVFKPVAAAEALVVPQLSVLRTGQRDVVVVDLGEGRFEPREVVLGQSGDGFFEVRSGVNEGERVVTSAQFLIDSEASVQEAIQKILAQREVPEGGGHGDAQ